MKIFIPGEEVPLTLTGRVGWVSFNTGVGYRYKIGIDFDTFGDEKSLNPRKALDKIRDLEARYSPELLLEKLRTASGAGLKKIETDHKRENNVEVWAKLERRGGILYKRFRVYQEKL